MTAPLDDALRTQLRGYRREQVDEVIRVLEGRVAAHDAGRNGRSRGLRPSERSGRDGRPAAAP